VVDLPSFLVIEATAPVWLLAGLGLIALSLLVPEPALVAMGFAGVVTALVALTIVELPRQLLIWGVLSLGMTLILRGMVPSPSKALEQAQYAQISTRIPPGDLGKVQYEGSSWRARCQVSDVELSPGEWVAVVGRQGNVLTVLPIPDPATPPLKKSRN
jgi:membrane protein implicated in regulation of membrane protease activity